MSAASKQPTPTTPIMPGQQDWTKAKMSELQLDVVVVVNVAWAKVEEHHQHKQVRWEENACREREEAERKAREEAKHKEREEAEKRAWLLVEWERILVEKAQLMVEDKCKAVEERACEAAEKRAWVVAQQKAKDNAEWKAWEEIARNQAEREQAYAEKKVHEEATRKQKAGEMMKKRQCKENVVAGPSGNRSQENR